MYYQYKATIFPHFPLYFPYSKIKIAARDFYILFLSSLPFSTWFILLLLENNTVNRLNPQKSLFLFPDRNYLVYTKLAQMSNSKRAIKCHQVLCSFIFYNLMNNNQFSCIFSKAEFDSKSCAILYSEGQLQKLLARRIICHERVEYSSSGEINHCHCFFVTAFEIFLFWFLPLVYLLLLNLLLLFNFSEDSNNLLNV